MTKTMQTAFSAFLLCTSALTLQASSITINSTCEIGPCSTADVLAVGQSRTTAFDFNYSFADTDKFRIQGNLFTSNSNGFQVSITDFAVTYEGNEFGTASGNDVVVADFLQNITNPASYSTTAYESIGGNLGPGLGSASSASGQFLIAGKGLPLLGPYTGTGSFSGYDTGSLTIPSGSPLLDYRYALTFGSGSQIGSSIDVNPTTPPVPEPGTLILVTTGALGLLRVIRARKARRIERI